jgi:hypothetical protein
LLLGLMFYVVSYLDIVQELTFNIVL